MKKLSLAMLTIALWLLFVWSANAMTYTVDWDETQVSIPSDTSEWITIDWWDWTSSTLATNCGARVYLSEVHEYVYKCTKTYDPAWEYTININNNNGTRVTLLYLNSSNISSITNFNWFSQLSTIYLRNNWIVEVGSNALSSLRSDYATIHLESNSINSFLPEMTNVRNLYLNENELTTIPSTIWDARENTEIKLSNTVSYGDSSKSKLADLRDNDIEFIKITEIDWRDSSSYPYNRYWFQNATSYQFARFGYSYNNSNLSFDYEILDGDDNSIISDETDDTSITITDPLKPWNHYTFKVCLHDDTVNCDSFTFDVDYTEAINFTSTSPNNWTTTTSINGISFTWQRTWNYPASFVSWYSYTITKDWTTIDWWDAPDGSASYSLDRDLIEDNPNWHYVFTVYLLDKDWNIISYVAPATTSFDIAVDNTVTINSPIWTQLWQEVHSVDVNFDWETSSTLFKYYEYYITTADSCSPSATHLTWGTSNTAHTIFNHTLWIWEYLLCLDMYNTSNNKVNDNPISSDFSVVIPAIVDITSPTSTVSTQPIQFSRDIFLPNPYAFRDYTYIVKKWTEDVASDTITNKDSRSFSLNNLRDWTYSVNVTMHYDDGIDIESVSDTKTFTVNSSAGVYLNLTPSDWETFNWDYIRQVPVSFSWEWWWSSLISKYTYKLTNTDTSEIIDSGTKNSTDALSLWTKSLPSGSYRFEVVMLDSDNHEITNSYSDFTVVIPSDLQIISPLPWLSATKDVTFSRSWFYEFGEHYSYLLNKIDGSWNETIITSNDDTTSTSFTRQNLINGTYKFTVSLINEYDEPIITKNVNFLVPDSQGLTLSISDWQHSVTTLTSKTWIFSRLWESENFDSYSYSVAGTTFKNESYSYNWTSRSAEWNFTLNDLSSWIYRFTVTMLDSDSNIITWKYLDFNVAIPATLKITSPTSWTNITTASATFTWSWYSDVFTEYKYELTWDPISSTTSTSFTKNNLTNGNYTLTVWLYSWTTAVAQDSTSFTVNIPAPKPSSGGGGWASWKTHYNNNLKVSLWNDSPTTNDRIKLIIKIDEKYTWKVSFPKLQYYSPDTEKWIDIPVTSKNYVSDYSDEAKLGYVKFTSDDDWRIEIPQFIKFSKNWYYRIYAEDKDGYDADVEVYVKKATTVTNTNNTSNTTSTTNKQNTVDSIIQQFIPEVSWTQNTSEEVYVARSCKKYTITYSDSLNVYTSPNLNISEYFVTKDYFKRYIDSKNKYQSGCPTNIWWISTSYSDNSNDNSRYTAPNGKVYFITWQPWNYYSNELNKELKTPTSFNTIQELKYYIRDRNPLISMAALGPIK